MPLLVIKLYIDFAWCLWIHYGGNLKWWCGFQMPFIYHIGQSGAPHNKEKSLLETIEWRWAIFFREERFGILTYCIGQNLKSSFIEGTEFLVYITMLHTRCARVPSLLTSLRLTLMVNAQHQERIFTMRVKMKKNKESRSGKTSSSSEIC